LVDSASEDLARQRELLSTTLKLIRGLRRMSAREVADAMGLKLRTYYSFEAGQGPLDIAKIYRFALATDSDPAGIMDTLQLGDPAYALRCMDNKAASIQLASFRRFNDRVGDRMTHIGPSIWIEAFKRPFDSAEDYLEKRDQSTERWLEENLPKILPPDKPEPPDRTRPEGPGARSVADPPRDRQDGRGAPGPSASAGRRPRQP
jgi:transcriptional regulator with XRE-family HTH domain